MFKIKTEENTKQKSFFDHLELNKFRIQQICCETHRRNSLRVKRNKKRRSERKNKKKPKNKNKKKARRRERRKEAGKMFTEMKGSTWSDENNSG